MVLEQKIHNKAGEFNEKYGFDHGHKDYLIHLYISTSSNYLV